MLHLVPVPHSGDTPLPCEAMAKLAGIRRALRLVDPFGGGPASDPSDDDDLAAAWARASNASGQRFVRPA